MASYPTRPMMSPNSSSPTPLPSVKHLTCAFWAANGCRYSDEECKYAHHHTGSVAEMPIYTQVGMPAVAGRAARERAQFLPMNPRPLDPNKMAQRPTSAKHQDIRDLLPKDKAGGDVSRTGSSDGEPKVTIPLDRRYLEKAYSKSSDDPFYTGVTSSRISTQSPYMPPFQAVKSSPDVYLKRMKLLENVIEMLWVSVKAAEGELREGGRFLMGQMSVDSIAETSDSHLELAEQLKRLRNVAKEDLAEAGATRVTKQWKERFRNNGINAGQAVVPEASKRDTRSAATDERNLQAES